MTIPSRPAPAPPGSRAQNAVATGANASLEQLRFQLQQQQLQQQQTGSGLQKLTIKLPPPPKGPQSNPLLNRKTATTTTNSNNNLIDCGSATSITRKFPQARYTPTTNWDDSPFGSDMATLSTNGNFKKMPPPRPPPPKVQVNGRKTSAPATPGTSLITNIFNRKKTSLTTTTATKAATQNRVYGLSSGISTSATNASTITTSSTNSNNTNSNYGWPPNWNSNATSTTTNYSGVNGSSNLPSTTVQEAQLISFDSPPASPTFTQKSNSDCVSVDSFSSDSNFSSPNNGSVSQPESGFEDDFSASVTGSRSRPATTSPLGPWETLDAFGVTSTDHSSNQNNIYGTVNYGLSIGTAPVRNLSNAITVGQQTQDNPLCNGKSLLPPPSSLQMPTIIKPKISAKPKAPKPPLLAKPNYILYGSDPPTPPSPPMPKVAPPPPPAFVNDEDVNGGRSLGTGTVSILDVISGKVDAMALSSGSSGYIEETITPYGIALYDFDGVEEDDLSFRENEKIYLLEQVSEQWYRGRTRAGCEGIFPGNYIDIKVPLGADTATTQFNSASKFSESQQSSSSYYQTQQHNQAAGTRVRCLYNFPAEVEGDLALKENDLVTILYKINEDWLYGEINGKQGQFPANFLEYVPDNLPMP